MNDMTIFEKEVRIRLLNLGINQTELGKKTNIPRNRVNDAIKGRREGRKYRKLIAEFLEINDL